MNMNTTKYVLTVLDYSAGKTYVFNNVPAYIAEEDSEESIEEWLTDKDNPVGGFNLDEISYMLTPEEDYSEEELDFESADDDDDDDDYYSDDDIHTSDDDMIEL